MKNGSGAPRPVMLAISAMTATTLCLLPVQAEGEEERRSASELSEAIARLVPYDLDGTTFAAFDELSELAQSTDHRAANTAAFMRAAAAVELLTFATLEGNSDIRSQVAGAVGRPPEELVTFLDSELAQISSRTFEAQAESWRHVLSCLGSPDRERCGSLMRRVADADTGASTAARMTLLHQAGSALGEARRGAPSAGSAALAATAAALCADADHESVRAHCDAEPDATEDSSARLGEAIFAQAQLDVAALRHASRSGDALAGLASSWLEGAVSNLGWLATYDVLRRQSIPDVELPMATLAPDTPPVAFLVVGRSQVTVAAAPIAIVSPTERLELDGGEAPPLPGRAVLALPATFRPVIVPIPQVIRELTALRGRIEATFDAVGEGGPDWISDRRRTLGLVIDRSVTLVDLARYVQSAREAGFERFAFYGARRDGRLAPVVADVGSIDAARATVAMPLVRVTPREVLLESGAGATTSFSRISERSEAARAAAALLQGAAEVIAVRGRPMMPYGLLFPVLEAVTSATDHEHGRSRLLLPR